MLKGFNLSSWVDESTALGWIDEVADKGCNLIRYQLVITPEYDYNDELSMSAWLREALYKAGTVLSGARWKQPHVMFIIDLHTPYKGLVPHKGRLCTAPFVKREARAVWLNQFESVVSDLEHFPNVWGFQPCNEPTPYNKRNHKRMMKLARRRLRKRTSKKNFVVSSRGADIHDIKRCPFIGRKRTVYDVHMYMPQEIISAPYHDPAIVPERKITVPALNKFFEPVEKFVARNDARVIIGETGAFPTMGQEMQRMYLGNVLEHCKQRGIDVCLHPFLDPQWKYKENDIVDTFEKHFKEN